MAQPDPAPVRADYGIPLVCVCGRCGRACVNDGVAKREHARNRCVVNGVQLPYFVQAPGPAGGRAKLMLLFERVPTAEERKRPRSVAEAIAERRHVKEAM